MLVPARAADRSNDAGERERAGPAASAGTSGEFRRRLGAALSRPAAGGVETREDADGIRVFLTERSRPHLLAWQGSAGRRIRFADCVPLAGPHASAAWRQMLVPDRAMRVAAAMATGLAVFDADGLLGRFEFAWVRGPSGWQLEPGDDSAGEPARGEFTPSPLDVEAVPAALRGAWTASCGRCRRFALGRGVASAALSLCRRDCLPTNAPF
jgi:hypothetical protein